MDRLVYVIGHRSPDTDSVCSAIAYASLKNRLGEANVRPARAGELSAETAFVLRTFDLPLPERLTDASGLDLILVDHNEAGQALRHIEKANILEIWEHHRIGDLRLPKPIFFHCEPVGATATLIGELHFQLGVTPSRPIAGILLAAILSDTLVFRSPTTTQKDRAMAARLAPLAGVEPSVLGEQLLGIRTSAAEHRSAAELLSGDFKEFLLSGHRVGIAQVDVLRPDALAGQKAAVLREMRSLRETTGLDQLILMITNLADRACDLWFVGDHPEVFERAFGRLEADAVHLPGTMSRKQQVVPPLEAAFAEPGNEAERA